MRDVEREVVEVLAGDGLLFVHTYILGVFGSEYINVCIHTYVCAVGTYIHVSEG